MKNKLYVLIVTMFIYSLIASPSFAYDITVGELSDYLNKKPGNDLSSYITKTIENKLAQNNLTLANGTLLYSSSSYTATALEIKDRIEDIYCVTRRPQILLKNVVVNATAASNSNISLILSQPSGTLTATFQGPIRTEVTGYLYAKARSLEPTWWGGVECKEKETWSAGFRATNDAYMSATVSLGLSATFDATQKVISVTPKVSMYGEVSEFSIPWNFTPYDPRLPADLYQWEVTEENINTTIDEKLLGGVGDYLVTNLLKEKANDKLNKKLEQVEADLNAQVNTYLAGQGASCIDMNGDTVVDQCTLLYKIPEIDPMEHVLDMLAAYLLYNVVENGEWLDPGYDYLRNNYPQLAYYALTGNKEALRQQFLNAGTCVAINQGRVLNMPYTSLYQLNGSSCSPANLRAPVSGAFYSGSQCTTPVDYKETTLADYCTESLTPSALGNADMWDGADGLLTQTPWSLLPSTQINVGVMKIDNNHQPFTKRVKYKTIDNGIEYVSVGFPPILVPVTAPEDRYCKLEMRVYKKDISGTNLKPLLAVHGGSWSYRGLGFTGLESQVSQFTERGYVVFSPFYRLTRSADGPRACNNATGREVLDDIKDALQWVQNHQSEYGGNGKISVFGQSAGAHLVTWLTTQNPSQIEKGLLLYPPVDAKDYIEQVNQGNVPGAMGVSALKGFLGDTSEDPTHIAVAPDDPFVIENTFTRAVQANPTVYPPMFVLHGASDTLVPSRQAVRMCNALAGNADSVAGPAINDGGNPSLGEYSKKYSCGNKNSQLVLIAEADHVFDACPSDILSKLAGNQVADAVANKICPAGSINSVHEAEKRLLEGFRWLTTDIAAIMSIIDQLLLN